MRCINILMLLSFKSITTRQRPSGDEPGAAVFVLMSVFFIKLCFIPIRPQQDIRHLEAIQSASASSREFLLVMRMEEKEAADERGLRQLEKALCDHGVRVQLVEEQDVKRLLAVYYQHDVTTDYFEDVDGERAVTGNG